MGAALGERLAERRVVRQRTRRRRRGGDGRAPLPVQRLARRVDDAAASARDAGRAVVAGDRPFVVGLVGLLALSLVMLSGPMRSYADGRERVELLEAQLAALEAENGRLDQRARDLHDPEQVELLAREQQGMIRPGEVPYQVVPPESARPRIAPPRTVVVPATDDAWYERLWGALSDLFG